MTDENLTKKTINGVAWTFLDGVARYGITFIVSVVLARLLSPEEYGLIGILMIFINLFNVVVEGGFTNAIIRKKDATDIDYSTVFYTNLVLSILMCLLLISSSWKIADFFNQPILKNLTQVMSLIIIINAVAIVPRVKLTKAIDFKSQTNITVISSILSGLVGIVLALYGVGVWSLVWQQITCHTLTVLLLWSYTKWVPKMRFSWKSFHEMWNFGWKLLASGVINSLWSEVYQIVIGKSYSTYALGLYTRASQFSGLCASNINTIVQKVSFPVLSTIQDDISRLKDAYKTITCVTMFVTFVLLFGLLACSQAVVYVLVGEKWMECVPMMQILCLQMMFFPLHGINTIAIQVVGRSDITLKLNIFKCAINTFPIIIGLFTNIYAMLISSVFTNVICYLLNAYYCSSLIGYSIKEQVKDIMPSFILALFMAVIVFSITFLNLNNYIILFIQIVIGVAVTMLLCRVFKIKEYNTIKMLIKRKI